MREFSGGLRLSVETLPHLGHPLEMVRLAVQRDAPALQELPQLEERQRRRHQPARLLHEHARIDQRHAIPVEGFQIVDFGL